MTWLVRFTVSFFCTVMLFFGAVAVAENGQYGSFSSLPLLFAVFFAALCWVGYKLLASNSDLLSPLAAGFLWGSVAFCAVLMFISLKYWQWFDETRLLVLACSQLLAAAVISFAAPRQIPYVKALTVAGGMAFILLAAASLRILFLSFSVLLACIEYFPGLSPEYQRIFLLSVALGPVLGSAYLIATVLLLLRLLGLVKALQSPLSEQRDRKLTAAVGRFRNIALISVSLWWISMSVIWVFRLESLI